VRSIPNASTTVMIVALCLVALLTSAEPSPAGKRASTENIVFSSEFGDELFVMNTKTREKRTIPLRLAEFRDLTYSQALHALALVGSRTEGGQHSIFLLHWPRWTIEALPNLHEAPYRPAFSPDGKFVYAVDYGPKIFRYSIENKTWQRVPVEGLPDFHAQGLAFSPSGRRAAISPGDFKGFIIADVAAERFRVSRTVLSDFDGCTSPRWLDENTILFAGRRQPGLQFLWTFDLSTGQVRQLSNPPIGVRDFIAVSPDGKNVVFTGDDGKKVVEWTIWLLPLDSLQAVKLLPGKRDDSFLFPAWVEQQ